MVKEENLNKQIEDIEKQLTNIKQSDSSKNNESEDADSLDQFMVELHSNKPDKYTIGRLKVSNLNEAFLYNFKNIYFYRMI